MTIVQFIWLLSLAMSLVALACANGSLKDRVKSLETEQAVQGNSLDRESRRIDNCAKSKELLVERERITALTTALRELEEDLDNEDDEEDITGLVDDQEPLLTDAQRVQAHFDVSQAATMSELITRLKGV